MSNTIKKIRTAHVVWLGLLALSFSYILSSLHVVSDITQFMPNKYNDKNVQLLLDELQHGSTARLLILSIKGDKTKNLADLSRQLKEKLKNNSNFNLIHNGQQTFNTNDFLKGKYSLLYKYRYLLSANTSLSKENLSLSLKQRLFELRSGISVFKNTLSSDPQNHFIQYNWKLTERSEIKRHNGVWFNKDLTAVLLLLELNLDSFNLDKQQDAIEKIHTTILSLSDNEGLHVDITGAASMAVKTRAAIQETSKWLSSIALILMSLLFWWSYRSIPLFFLAMLPLISAVIIALTITNLIFHQVHGIIIAFGITLLGVSLDYPVHLFSHHTKHKDPHKTLLSIWPTLRLGVITTALAYLSMLGTSFGGLSQLAVFAISGLMTALFVTRWILPSLLPLDIKKPKHSYISLLSKINIPLKTKIYFFLSTTLFCIFVMASHHDSIWSKNISDLSPIPEKTKKLDQQLRRSIAAPDVNHVFLIKDTDSERLLQRTENVSQRLNDLKKQHLVKNIFSVTDFIPSKKTQQRHQQQLPNTEHLIKNIQSALTDLPFKKDFFNPFIKDIEQSKNLTPLTVKEVLASPLGKYLQQDLFIKHGEWISIIRLSGVKNETALLNWIASNPDIQSHYLNLRKATSLVMADYQKTAFYRLLLGALIIALILLVVRPKFRAVSILLPVVLAVFLSISIQVLIGTQLTLFHILALLLIIGIGLDYSLFFDREWTSSEDFQHRLHGIFVSAASTLITFGILSFSDIPVLSALGQTVTYGVLGCFVLTLVFNINYRNNT